MQSGIPPFPSIKSLKCELLNDGKNSYFKEAGPVLAPVALYSVAIITLVFFRAGNYIEDSASEQWYFLAALISTFLLVMINGIAWALKSRKNDEFEKCWEREQAISKCLSHHPSELVRDFHHRLKTQLEINKQQSGSLIIDAAALSAILAACSAVMVALMLDHKPFMLLLYTDMGLGGALLVLLIANLLLARDSVLVRRLASAALKESKMAVLRENSEL